MGMVHKSANTSAEASAYVSTCLVIKVYNYKIWWWVNVDKSLQCDRMELLDHPESMFSLGFGHRGCIDVVVEDIFSLMINTPFN
jgi:hypothetical protein